jgi:hypothetical protein
MSNMAFNPPPGLTNIDTVFKRPGRWANGSLARFFQDGWEVKGGWERLTLENLGGVCRSVLPWTDNTDILNIGFGLHNGLKAWQGSLIWDITPQYFFLPVTLTANPISTVNGSPTVSVAHANSGFSPGQQITISGATTPVNGIAPNGTWTLVTVTAGGYTFTAPGNATGTGIGGGLAVVVQNLAPWQAGQIDGTGGAGYGTGAYGVGTYGTPSNVEYFPATWSLATYGSLLVANPRGHSIWYWDTVTANKAVPLTGAPKVVTYMVVTPQRQIMAFGCNEEVSGVFNHLCIRWSDIEDPNDWITSAANNAGEWILESGGRLICARVIGDYVFAWTTDGLFLGTFVGAPGQTWKFERIGAGCGAISPGAPIVSTQYAAWISPDRTFWTCPLGGVPKVMECEIRSMFADHITQGQTDKIVGGSTATFQELTWFWPDDRDGFECSRALSVSPGGWSRDLLPRTAYCDSGPQPFPIGVAGTGEVYWHEKGHSADGGPLAGFIESTDFYLGEADGGLLLNGMWPDFKNQQGPLALTITTREFPQSTPRLHGPWSLAPGQSKRSFRVSGRIARVRFDWATGPAYARGGQVQFDTQAIGGR